MGILHGFFVCSNLDNASTMIMAFLLVVMVDGELVSTNDMLFENVYRCNQFAKAIERGELGPDKQQYVWQENISSYCLPQTVREGTFLFK